MGGRLRSGLALALLAVGVWAVSAASAGQQPPDGRLCVDVASKVGLQFQGDYGQVFDGDAITSSMQRNMGNGAAVGDYDADGDLDVYLLGQRGHPSRLFRNDLDRQGHAHFTDVTEAAGLGGATGMSRAAVLVDLDGDGRLDLVVANDHVPGSDSTPSRMYRNNGDGTFTDVTAGSGFDPTGYIVGGLAMADYDG